MNVIQRAWLIALRPVTAFVNDKLATRSGIIGRIGRFFAFGPREFGYHSTNKFLSVVNYFFVNGIASALHRRAFLKELSGNGFFTMRVTGFMMLTMPVMLFHSLLYMAVPRNAHIEDGTSLEHLTSQLPTVPINALEDRESAHFTEINGYYRNAMKQKLDDLFEQVARERQFETDKVKKTKYAVSSYKYIEPHTNVEAI